MDSEWMASRARTGDRCARPRNSRTHTPPVTDTTRITSAKERAKGTNGQGREEDGGSGE